MAHFHSNMKSLNVHARRDTLRDRRENRNCEFDGAATFTLWRPSESSAAYGVDPRKDYVHPIIPGRDRFSKTFGYVSRRLVIRLCSPRCVGPRAGRGLRTCLSFDFRRSFRGATTRYALRRRHRPDFRIVPVFLPAFESVIERLADIGEGFVVMDLGIASDLELAAGQSPIDMAAGFQLYFLEFMIRGVDDAGHVCFDLKVLLVPVRDYPVNLKR